MTAVKDNAVCIGRRNYSETSQILTLFSLVVVIIVSKLIQA